MSNLFHHAPVSELFSKARKASGLLFLAGVIGLRADGCGGMRLANALDADDEDVCTDLAPQFGQSVRNIEEVLKVNGYDLLDIVDVTVFLVSMEGYDELNAAYDYSLAEKFKNANVLPPTRTTVAVSALPLGALVELKVIARKRPARK